MTQRIRVACGTVVFKGDPIAHVDLDFLEEKGIIERKTTSTTDLMPHGAKRVVPQPTREKICSRFAEDEDLEFFFFKKTNEFVLIGLKKRDSAIVLETLYLPFGIALHALRA